jgi:trehalose/maltose hydrolase-like predicted phosphorylase
LATLFGNDKLAWDFFLEALTSDYIDIQGGTTQEGIHTGVMGATVLIVLKAYAGLTFENGVPKVKSSLPA